MSYLLNFLKHSEEVQPQHACQVRLVPVPTQQFSNQNRVFRHILQTLRKPTKHRNKHAEGHIVFYLMRFRADVCHMAVWNRRHLCPGIRANQKCENCNVILPNGPIVVTSDSNVLCSHHTLQMVKMVYNANYEHGQK